MCDYKSNSESYVRRLDLRSPTFTVSTIASIVHSGSGITTDGNELYITSYWFDSVNLTKKRGTIWHCTFDGSSYGTIAGNASLEPGSLDGTGTGATFNDPQDVTTDGTYLYIVENTGLKIRRMHIASKTVTTLDGTIMAGYTNGIVVDADSLFYLSKSGSSMILNRHE